jgi:hypothetical protein
MYDQDGSGFIEVTELEEIMNKIGRNSEQGGCTTCIVCRCLGPRCADSGISFSLCTCTCSGENDAGSRQSLRAQ